LRAAHGYLDDDLRWIFRVRGSAHRPIVAAARLLRRHRKFIADAVSRRLKRRDARVVGDLLDKVRSRVKALGLVYLEDDECRTLAELFGLVLHKAVLFEKLGTFRDG